MSRRRGYNPILVFVVLANAFGCGGGGCSCMSPIPGGFPAAERTQNAGQIRVSQTGLASLTSDPAALISAVTGGPLAFDIPDSCGGTPAMCCPGGNPVSPCGPINIDLGLQGGDDPRMVVTPVQGASRIDLIVRARVTTGTPVPVGLFGLNCELVLDTTATGSGDPYPDLQIAAPINLIQDGTAGTTRIEVGDVTVSRFTDNDFSIQEPGGGFGLCDGVNWGAQYFVDTIAQTFADQIKGAIADQACKTCPSGDVAECGSQFATACDSGTCMEGDVCLQEIGIDGRMLGAAILGGFSPGTTGAMDVYEVAGGYATTNSGGVALGLLGGMLPSGEEHARCGPPATAPAAVTIPQSPYFSGNTRPDTGAAYDLGVGIHESQLDELAYAGYDGGIMCLTIDNDTIDLVNSGSFQLLIPSLQNLAPSAVPMAIGLRPQAPPTIQLGLNTFIDDGNGNVTVDDPLLDITFLAMEVDFFAAVEGQYVRLFTLVADVELPIGLQVGTDGTLVPVLGELTDAFTNLSAKNTEPLLETPEALADVFPTILQLALGQLGSLGAIDVPTLAGLQLDITDITAVDSLQFLAIYGALAPAAKPSHRVDTRVTASRLDDAGRLHLSLAGGTEYSYRTDGGWWSAWSPASERTIAPATFRLQGHHIVEVRARTAGDSYSTDATPAVIDALLDDVAPALSLGIVDGGVRIDATDNVSRDRLVTQWRFPGERWTAAPAHFVVPLLGRDPAQLEVEAIDEAGLAASASGADATRIVPFHGTSTQSGCGCASDDGGGGGTAGLLIVVGLGWLGMQRRRRSKLRALLASLLFVALAASLPACNCGNSAPCGDVECLPGDVARGATGRWNGVDADSDRAVVSTYDMKLGDLVVVDVAGGEPVYVAVDGIPDETPTHDPGTYRGGIETAGPNIGGWTSIKLADGRARVSYQDLDNHVLKFAIEHDNDWIHYPLDDAGGQTGFQTSLTIDGDGAPAIAYVAVAAGGAGPVSSELRLARASGDDPTDAGAWTISTIATAVSSCASLCGDGLTCVTGAADGDPQECAAETGDCTTACADGETCVAGACRTDVADQVGDNIALGLSSPTAVTLSDGRLGVVYYDQARTALVALVETASGSSNFGETVLDGADAEDRGMWASATTDGSTIHVAYQDALRDELFYTTWAGGAGTPALVDDGMRPPDRPHNVGAGAAIFIDNGTPKIAYQDGLASDIELGAKNGNAWTHSVIASGTLLDGFHLAACNVGPWLVWDSLDKNRAPVGDLEVREGP